MNLLKPSLLSTCSAIALPLCFSGIAHAKDMSSHTSTPVKHVVVIFQENVSFDHYFGTYPHATNPAGEPAFHAKANTPAVNGLTEQLLQHNPNQVNPFRMVRNAEPFDQDHEYDAEQEAYNGGLMSQFFTKTGNKKSAEGQRQVMGYYDGNTVTALWNYAQHFAMSDNSYGTIFGPSTPGALNLVVGRTGPVMQKHTKGVDGGNLVGDNNPRLDDCSYSDVSMAKQLEKDLHADDAKHRVVLTGRNVGDLLNKKHVTWGWFEGGFDPTSYKDGIAVCGAKSTNQFGVVQSDYIPHHEPFQYFESTTNPHHLPPSSIAKVGKTDQANHQYSLNTFWKAADAGHLPAVSFLKAKGIEDGHAGYSNPLDEQRFIVNTINRLEKLPSWKNTVVVIAYDDSDGYYDHVMPPKNDFADKTGRHGYGPRLPLLVVSPYAKTNFIDHSVTDQSSVMRFIEDNWRLGRVKDSMDAHAGTLNNMLDFGKHKRAHALFLNPETGEISS